MQNDSCLENPDATWVSKMRGIPGKQNTNLLSELEDMHQRLRDQLQGPVFHMLTDWAKLASKNKGKKSGKLDSDQTMQIACRTHAHICLTYKNVPAEKFTEDDVAIFLSSQMYVNMNHRWFRAVREAEKEQPKQDGLGISEFELFDIFEARRSRIARWLRQNKGPVTSKVMRRVAKVVTMGVTIHQVDDDDVEWVEIPTEPGNYQPKAGNNDWRKPLVKRANTAAAPEEEEYQEWLLRVTEATRTGTVSVNLGRFLVRGGGMQLLPDWALDSEDYMTALGKTEVHVSDKEITRFRQWKALDGTRHEVVRWEPMVDSRTRAGDAQTQAVLPVFSSLGGPSVQKYDPDALAEDRRWLANLLEPVRARLGALKAMALYYDPNRTDLRGKDRIAHLVGVHTEKTQEKQEKMLEQIKEVVVHSNPPLVEVYDVYEFGRQYYRSLVFTSDCKWSFHTPTAGAEGSALMLYNASSAVWTMGEGRPESIRAPAPSVLIYRRTLDAIGRQMYVPSKLLQGLMPDALLERYTFWRSETSGNVLIGDESNKKVEVPTRLTVVITSDNHGTTATIERVTLKEPTDRASRRYDRWEVDTQKPKEVLVNLRKSTGDLAMLLARVENVSHILVWANSSGKVCRVEYPRIWVSFTEKGGRLFCDQHSGCWLLTRECPHDVTKLVAQFGGGTLLLEDDMGAMMVLASSVAEPVRPALVGKGSGAVERLLPGQLVFKCGQERWMRNLVGGARHHYYPVHPSGTFLFTPTLAAGLYLLICRFITWHFPEVVAQSATISEALTPEEKQLWSLLDLLVADCHADAVACRLNLTLAMAPYGAAMACPWQTKEKFRHQVLEYLRKRHFVSADCALSLKDEVRILNLPGMGLSGLELATRKAVLEQLLENGGGDAAVPADLGPLLDDYGYDRIKDDTWTVDRGYFGKIAVTAWIEGKGAVYRRPPQDELSGIEALRYLNGLASGVNALWVPSFLIQFEFTSSSQAASSARSWMGMSPSTSLRASCGSRLKAERRAPSCRSSGRWT
ncbi:unnamed protein product [Prorocentrum cordatum]|uniref:Uncharacterized protein n=1 Tax=Prorocentrum cordatum TaxID=2364126 RepID=A0ABN9U790_9DINO|nr:unnamed protein product [Polarella glacialis]